MHGNPAKLFKKTVRNMIVSLSSVNLERRMVMIRVPLTRDATFTYIALYLFIYLDFFPPNLVRETIRFILTR